MVKLVNTGDLKSPDASLTGSSPVGGTTREKFIKQHRADMELGMFGLSSLFGIDIHEAPMIPRYQLPEELIPGVPWDPKFRAEINAWAKNFLGYTCVVPRDTVYMIHAGKTAIMHPLDAVKLINVT
jgi:hypothetical protein